MWEWFSAHCRTTSPLYERISLAVAGDHELLDLVRAAPPSAHLPPALLAAVHYLILEGSTHPLADVYAGRSDADPGPLFLDFFRSRQPDVMAILAVRHIQTNECGRSAVIGPGLTWLASQLEGPYSLVDVGASAGLNLLCDRYRMAYGTHGTTGPIDAAVQISCRVVGGDPPGAGEPTRSGERECNGGTTRRAGRASRRDGSHRRHHMGLRLLEHRRSRDLRRAPR
jgi:hypothetical protein